MSLLNLLNTSLIFAVQLKILIVLATHYNIKVLLFIISGELESYKFNFNIVKICKFF